MATLASADTMKASPFPNVATKGAQFFETLTVLKALGIGATVGAELETVMRGADPDAVPPITGTPVFAAPAEDITEADYRAIFEEAPQFLDIALTIVLRYAVGRLA